MLCATRLPLRVLPSTLVLCAVMPVALAAQAFEGSVTMRVNLGTRASAQAGAAATQQLEYQVRGGKVRVNMGGPMGGMAMLAVPQERKLYMLMAAQQTYMEVPMAEAATAAGSVPEPDVKVTRTGKKETIAGLSCEHVLVAQGKAPPTDHGVPSTPGVGHRRRTRREVILPWPTADTAPEPVRSLAAIRPHRHFSDVTNAHSSTNSR